MNQDFLEGIDEQFEPLTRLQISGRRSGRFAGRLYLDDRLIDRIVDNLRYLSKQQEDRYWISSGS